MNLSLWKLLRIIFNTTLFNGKEKIICQRKIITNKRKVDSHFSARYISKEILWTINVPSNFYNRVAFTFSLLKLLLKFFSALVKFRRYYTNNLNNSCTCFKKCPRLTALRETRVLIWTIFNGTGNKWVFTKSRNYSELILQRKWRPSELGKKRAKDFVVFLWTGRLKKVRRGA